MSGSATPNGTPTDAETIAGLIQALERIRDRHAKYHLGRDFETATEADVAIIVARQAARG